MSHLLDRTCIQRLYTGGSEDINFNDFAMDVIQEHDLAAEVAHRMLNGDDPYQWNEDEPEFYEEFLVLDAAALRAQVAAVE